MFIISLFSLDIMRYQSQYQFLYSLYSELPIPQAENELVVANFQNPRGITL